jgi:hypothetical protein
MYAASHFRTTVNSRPASAAAIHPVSGREGRPSSARPGSAKSKPSNILKLDHAELNDDHNEIKDIDRLDSQEEHINHQNNGGYITGRPLTPVAFSMVRQQTVRTNLDHYRIEQVALRRLRFVVENNQTEPEHLSIVDLVESG